jgi:hypothetical protein
MVLDPQAQAKRRFRRWAIVKAGVPWGIAMGVWQAVDRTPGPLWSRAFAARLALSLLWWLPWGLLFGFFWAGGMWAAGFGRNGGPRGPSDSAA